MNIFVTSVCPVESAKALDDKRVVKMCLETAQLLSTALREHGVEDERLYRPTHRNHPSNVWARQTRSNFVWLLVHFEALLAEYTDAYGREHKSGDLLPAFYEHLEAIPEGDLTEFANCARNKSLGLDFTDVACVFTAYKLYLMERWWTDKREPTWSRSGQESYGREEHVDYNEVLGLYVPKVS